MGLADDFLADAGKAGVSPAPVNPAPTTSLSDQFKADASAGGQSGTSAHMADINKARSEMGGVLDNLKNLGYGGLQGLAGITQGIVQPVLNGTAGILGNEGFSGKPGPASQWVIDKAKQYNEHIAEQEAKYQAETPGSGAAGLGRVATSVLPFLAGGAAEKAPEAAGYMGKLIQMLKSGGETAIKGAGYGVAQPVTDVKQTDAGNDYWATKAKQGAIGGASSLAAIPIGNMAARIISPKTAPEVKSLMDQGITPTPGQILGGGFAKSEDKLTSVPLVGDMIKNAQRRSVEDFNRTTYNRALSPIGEKSEAEIGRPAVGEIKSKLGQAYDNLLPKLQFKADPQFSSEVNNLTSMISNGNVPPEIAKQFNSIVKNEVFSRMTKQGSMDGQSFKELETKLGLEIKRFSKSQDPNDQALGSALSEVLTSARGSLARTNPQYAGDLAKINEGYANYTKIRDASSRLGASNGVFTPEQLQSAVRAGDKSVGKGNFATGNALMQDLSEAGKNVLGAKYPDSGTPGRALMASLPAAAGAAYLNPGLAALAGIGGTAAVAPYTQIGQKLAAALLAKRPDSAPAIANAVRAGSPMVGAAVSPALLEALKNYSY